MNSFDIFLELLNSKSIQQIATGLFLHKGTVQRWYEKASVPENYYFELCKLAGISIDYSKFTYKQKDQFFTIKETAQYCIDQSMSFLKTCNININEYTFIEPAAGSGSFYNLLPENKIGLDIEPRGEGIIEQDFLDWLPSTEKNIIIGNPPFGLRGNLALKFINHAAKFSDFVFFILPQLFESSGKGNCKDRVKDFNLVSSEKLNPSFFYPDNKKVSVNVVFQIWSKLHESSEEIIKVSQIKIYSLSDGGSPSNTRNKNMLDKCDFYLPSTVFGKKKVKLYPTFEDLPLRRGYGIVILKEHQKLTQAIKKVKWEETAFPSTNGAYNLRMDLIEKGVYKCLK